MTNENNVAIVPIANLNYEEVMLIIDILKRRYPKPTPMIILSAYTKSEIASPSFKNSGLEATEKSILKRLLLSTPF